jgi:fluoride ion exporter CrcB/FEX
MTLGTEMSSLIGIAGSLFLIIRTEITKMKMDKISMLAGIGCAGGLATPKSIRKEWMQ